MAHPYEYRFIVEYLTPVPISGKPNFGEQRDQMILNQKFAEFTGRLPEMIDEVPGGDGWEVNSHSFMWANDTIVVSILLQRPRR